MKFLLVVIFALISSALAHKYKSGECPSVEPMQGFDMRKVCKISSTNQTLNDSYNYQEVFNVINKS